MIDVQSAFKTQISSFLKCTSDIIGIILLLTQGW